ncbi:hypothetical protein [Veillonella sp. CAG:933]|uniref:hypothetical protein n=1 Tax=Veillonella sp. CAG:933 TaxID=1262980 RepID=UPI00263F7B17|nr:hypothetical protein [Veillonella sp. CAG:933]
MVLQAKKTLRCGPLHFFFPEYFMSVFSDVEHSIRGFAQSPSPRYKTARGFLRKEGRDTISESLFAAQNQALEIASRPSQKSSRVLLN